MEAYKFTETTVTKLKEAFALGADVSAACYYAEINRKTYYDWCKTHVGFEDECNRLREKPVLEAYQTVANDMDKPDTAKWYLERKRKDEFSPKYVIEKEHNPTEEALEKEEEDLAEKEQEILRRIDERKRRVGDKKDKIADEKNRAEADRVEDCKSV